MNEAPGRRTARHQVAGITLALFRVSKVSTEEAMKRISDLFIYAELRFLKLMCVIKSNGHHSSNNVLVTKTRLGEIVLRNWYDKYADVDSISISKVFHSIVLFLLEYAWWYMPQDLCTNVFVLISILLGYDRPPMYLFLKYLSFQTFLSPQTGSVNVNSIPLKLCSRQYFLKWITDVVFR